MILQAMPSYVAAVHFCTDQVKEHQVQATILKAAPLKIRSRSRLHFGSQTECLYSLKTFGIPEDLLPVDPITKKICLKRHMSWIESRFAMERKERPLPAITPKKQNTINPSENDVLVGIGKKSNNMGNHRLRALVKELSQAYNSGSKETKKALVDCAIKSVEDSGGRFLREQNGYGWNVVWEDMPRDQIRKNVAQAFRNNNRRRKGE